MPSRKPLSEKNFQMIRRLIFFSVIIPTITVAFTAKTYAQSTDVCTFSQPTVGELVGEGGTLPTKLVSLSAAGGFPTQISVTCSQPVHLSVSAPIQIEGPTFNPVSSLVTVETPSGSLTNSAGSPLALPMGTTPLVINLSIDKASPLVPENYRYGIKFTILPQS